MQSTPVLIDYYGIRRPSSAVLRRPSTANSSKFVTQTSELNSGLHHQLAVSNKTIASIKSELYKLREANSVMRSAFVGHSIAGSNELVARLVEKRRNEKLVREIDRIHRYYNSVDLPASKNQRLVGDLMTSNRKLYRQAVFSTKQRLLSEQRESQCNSLYVPSSGSLASEFGTYLVATCGQKAKTFLDQFIEPDGSRALCDVLVDFLAQEFYHMHCWSREITEILVEIEKVHAESSLAETTVDSTITTINDTIKKYAKCDRVSIWMIDQATGEAWTKRQLEDGKTYQEIRVPKGAGLVGNCFTNRCCLNIPDAYADPRFDQRTDKATGYHTRSVLCVPIKKKLTHEAAPVVISVIQAINKCDNGEFSQNDQLIVSMFGAVASSVVIHCEAQTIATIKQARTNALMDSIKQVAEDSLSRVKSPLEALLIIKAFLHKAFDAIDCLVVCPTKSPTSVIQFRINEEAFTLSREISDNPQTSLFTQVATTNKIISNEYLTGNRDFNIEVITNMHTHGVPVNSRGICVCVVEFVTLTENVDEQIIIQFFNVSAKWITHNFL